MKKFLSAALFGAGLFVTHPAFAGPAVTTEWIEDRQSLETCKSRVEASIRAAGAKDVEAKRYTTFGFKGAYTIAVRCMPDQNVVFFIVSGDNLKGSDDVLDDVIAAYKKR